MSERLVHVTCAQIEQTNKPIDNLAMIVSVMEDCRTDLLVFPETQLSGESKIDSDELEHLQEVIAEQAMRYRQWVAYGSYAQTFRGNENMAFLQSPDGKIEIAYSKNHLWNEPGVTSGAINYVAQTKLGNIGMIICWDIRYPESIQFLADRGAELVICPSYWYGEEFKTTKVIDGLPLTRAFENQVYLAYCDAFTTDGSTAARSKICSPTKILAAAKPQTRSIIESTIDLSTLIESRRLFKRHIQ